jgi:dTDP-4-dehydrorhamnose reductase
VKVAVLGSGGQLGRDLCSRLSVDVVPLTRSDIDLDRPDTIAACLSAHRPDVFVNCAAYNLVDKAEVEPESAFRVNAWGVRELARACRDSNTRLVHVSTDYVFGLDHDRSTPYREDEAPGPVSVYGLSKLTGEYLVRSISTRHLVIRTCGLYGVWGSGGKGGNFVETMLRVAGQGKPLRVVSDQFCTPTYTADLADAIVQLIEHAAEGLFHVTNSGQMSWYEFAAEIFRQSGVNADLTPITSEQFGAAAKRPPYSVFSLEKLVTFGIPRPRPWQEALTAYLAERRDRSAK